MLILLKMENSGQKKKLSLSPINLQKLKNSEESRKIFLNNKVHIPKNFNRINNNFEYLDQEISNKNIANIPEKRFIFKKTFSRMISVQVFYEICFQIKFHNINYEDIDNQKILKISSMIIEINSMEWSRFNHKKVMFNFIVNNISYYLKNFLKIEDILEKSFSKVNPAKNHINDSILLSAIVEFLIFLEKTKNLESISNSDNDKTIEESDDHNSEEMDINEEINDEKSVISENIENLRDKDEQKSLKDKIIDQKKIIINEYIDIIFEFSDEFFIKYLNGILEMIFSGMIEEFFSEQSK